MFKPLVSVLTVLSILPNIQAAAPTASTLFLSETETQFSVNIANDTDDVFIYFSSPAYSWVAVGFGERMQNSLMFVMYPSEDGKNVTISPRIADGHSEPSFTRNIQLETLPGTEIKDEAFILKARCRNCQVWGGGYLDKTSTTHPMIYAFGPGNRLQSNKPDAPLKRHIRYGKFTMNMVAATGKGEVPAPSSALSGVEIKGGMTRDHDRANLAHAVIGCLALFIFWPLNVLLAGFFKKMKLHIGMSVFIMIFLIVAYALGIYTSGEYNRSKKFNSPHQILAFITLLPILLISILPNPRISQLTPIIPRLHTPLTAFTFTFLVLTGGLGLHLSNSSRPIILIYTSISLAVFLFILLIQSCIWKRGSRYSRHRRSRHGEAEEDEQDLVLAAWYAGRKMEEQESRSTSAASLNRHDGNGNYGNNGYSGMGGNGSGQNIYGGGTMPGPQYLMNMHPGVPVHKW
ncbi:iron reductase domain protein [Zopfia rhizophila CBS 207.26]|uniref:Iron reductase domain protein n=1 Tax=Zopfia rhizophila CBS 207.26 TaxID=1314779 RepID=A0A6A6DLW8_9PEZI|nr:iron reductase domain protein [Zopfia rhizophila CBS 207.26]